MAPPTIHLIPLQKLEVVHQLLDATGMHFAWIGAKDVHDDEIPLFITNNQATTFILWDAGQPNHSIGNCVKLSETTGRLYMADCTEALGYICEADP